MHRKYTGLKLNKIQIINYDLTEDGSQKTEEKKIDVVFETPDFGQKNKFIETKSSCDKIAGF